MSFFEQVYEMCNKIPKGKVATYGQIAFLIGHPKSARQVGWALSSCPSSVKVPCHRILNRFGKLCDGSVFGDILIQKQLLEEEGVVVREDNTIDLDLYLWNPN